MSGPDAGDIAAIDGGYVALIVISVVLVLCIVALGVGHVRSWAESRELYRRARAQWAEHGGTDHGTR